ncbi:hypoxanthine phosphoribosyltransferase [Fundidesulfovibrio butyratiphilus]
MPSRLEVIHSPDTVKDTVARLGREISTAYAGKPLLLLGVLKGAWVFLADLARALTIPVQVDFVRLSSYGDSDTRGQGTRVRDADFDCRGRHVLVVEDIVDTGHSMVALLELLREKGAESVALCALVDKAERREVEVAVDFYGFRLAKGFVVGYGMDYGEDYRSLPGLYELHLQKDD